MFLTPISSEELLEILSLHLIDKNYSVKKAYQSAHKILEEYNHGTINPTFWNFLNSPEASSHYITKKIRSQIETLLSESKKATIN